MLHPVTHERLYSAACCSSHNKGRAPLASLPIPSQVPLSAISSHRIAAIVSENSTRTRHDMYVDGMLLAHVAPARPPRDVENIKWLPTTPLPDCSSHSS
ncbi:hypothetical protein JI435_400700 [Parastagonospora nodorum SN15]|uniref:Uncharacterized protein n=1 Tax=Phaeosphaeria nodorum (strain SN15 / ATCC MYA-4574 / FGSC 10173) TaxID=321614 RepID=A0A7U2ES02_PHANO|nr:hypothetical protein JI435_400700 [Parastagonospora nodorum SN15]